MLETLVHTAVGVSGNTIGNWLADNVVYVLIVAVAIVILTFAITKKPRDAMVAFVIVLIALLVLSIGAFWRELGEWLRNTFFQG